MKNVKNMLSIVLLACTASCSTYYRVITTFDRNGHAHRELYALGDSLFMSGNTDSNPFLFELDSHWSIHRLDTVVKHIFFGEEKSLNVKITKEVTSIDVYAKEIKCDHNKRSLAAPKEFLEKKWRWFYLDYSFKATYQRFQYDVPLSIDDYLTKEEQILWTQGGLNNYHVMNGLEMSDYLSAMGEKFWEWHGRNRFEVILKGIKKWTTNYDFEVDKEQLYKQTLTQVDDETTAIEPKVLCGVLDSFYKTTYFSKLYNANGVSLDSDFKTIFAIEELIFNVLSYELVLPNRVLRTNAPIFASDTLVWKVDGMRLLFDDYILTAEYRTVNWSGFVFTGLPILVAVWSSLRLLTRSFQTPKPKSKSRARWLCV